MKNCLQQIAFEKKIDRFTIEIVLTLNTHYSDSIFFSSVIKNTSFVIVFLIYSWQISFAQQTSWKLLPIEGRFTNIATNPADPGTIYGTSPGFIHRSTNGGIDWIHYPYSVYKPSSYDMLYFDYSDRNHWFVLDDLRGCFETFDGGKTFEWNNEGINKTFLLSKCIQDPFNPSHYLIGFQDLFNSTNGGKSWIQITNSDTLVFYDKAFDPTNKGYVYAIELPPGIYSYFLKSTDNGYTWSRSKTTNSFKKLFIHPDGTIYGGSIFSTDQGLSWTDIRPSSTAEGGFITDLIFNPNDNYIYALDERDGLIRVQHGKRYWELVDFHTRYTKNLSLDIMNNRIYFQDYDHQQTFVSTNGASFFPLENKLRFPSVSQIISKDNTNDTLYAVIADNGFNSFSYDGGKSWKNKGENNFYTSAFLPNSDTIFFTQYDGFIGYSADGGVSWHSSAVSLGYSKCKINTLNPAYIYFSSVWGLIRTTLDRLIKAQTYLDLNNITSSISQGVVYDFSFHPTDPNIVYILIHSDSLNASNVYKTTDNGLNWKSLTHNTLFKSYYNTICIDQSNPENIYIGSDREGIIYSHAGGDNWHYPTVQPTNKVVTAIVVDPRSPNMIYACAPTVTLHRPPDSSICGGMYYSTDYGDTWQSMNQNGLLNFSIYNLHYFNNPPRLIACTDGGAYEYILPPITSVEKEKPPIAEEIILGQNFPNPFTRMTTITLTPYSPLPNLGEGKGERVSFKVYDVLGREVLDLSNQITQKPDNEYQVQITNSQLPASGLYFYRLSYQNKSGLVKTLMKRMCFIR